MKVVCHELAQVTSDPEGSAMDELVKAYENIIKLHPIVINTDDAYENIIGQVRLLTSHVIVNTG
jgi:hypothetical protein